MTSTSVKVIWADFGLIFNPCAQDETRTHTILRPLPPQSSVYTNFTTCARVRIPRTCLKALRFQRKCSGAPLFPSQTVVKTPWFTLGSLLIGAQHFVLVPRTGLEPAHLAACAPETHASTNSAIWASLHEYSRDSRQAARLRYVLCYAFRAANTSLVYISSFKGPG